MQPEHWLSCLALNRSSGSITHVQLWCNYFHDKSTGESLTSYSLSEVEKCISDSREWLFVPFFIMGVIL